jgi:hypothetical protein
MHCRIYFVFRSFEKRIFCATDGKAFARNMSYFFPSYIMQRTSYIQWNDYDVWFVLDKHAKLDL